MTRIPIVITSSASKALTMSSLFFNSSVEAGTMWDHKQAHLDIERPPEFADTNMYIKFKNAAISAKIALGTANTYPLERALTVSPQLEMQILFYDADEILIAQTNPARLFFREHMPDSDVSMDGLDPVPYPIPGPKGNAFVYEDFTPEQLASLMGPKGENGADGYTPVLGTDYWTDADKAEINAASQDYINEQLGVIANGSY